jgi:hypothetical protein
MHLLESLMGVKDDLRAAKAAQQKLETYCKGLPKGSVETEKYLELNAKADKAVRKLPRGLRSLTAVDLLGR